MLRAFEWRHAGCRSSFLVFVKNGEHLDPNFGKKFWEHLWSQRGYSRNYFKPNFRFLGPLVSILRAFEWQRAGWQSAFFALCQKWRQFKPKFWKKNSREHLWSQRGYSRDYFKPNFRSLAPPVSILRAFEWRHAGFWSAFLAFCQKRRPFRLRFWKNNFWEHLWSRKRYSREYFKPNFRSLASSVSILQAFEWCRAGFRSAFFGPLSKMEII